MSDTAKPNESAAIAAQRAMIARMKDAVLPPESGLAVGGLPPRAVTPQEQAGMKPDQRLKG